MGTIADKLQKLLGTKEAIRQAIIAKGQAAAEADTFASYADKIRAIQSGTDTSDATAAAGDILSGKTAYGPSGKISGTMPEVVQGTPTISVSTSGLITASATQTAGYVAAGTKSATRQLTTQAAATITPGTAAKTAVASGRYTTGAVTVAGSSNLVAGNIKSGVNIFGVTGSYAGNTPASYVVAITNYKTASVTVCFHNAQGVASYQIISAAGSGSYTVPANSLFAVFSTTAGFKVTPSNTNASSLYTANVGATTYAFKITGQVNIYVE